jgi:hypothetical protein
MAAGVGSTESSASAEELLLVVVAELQPATNAATANKLKANEIFISGQWIVVPDQLTLTP